MKDKLFCERLLYPIIVVNKTEEEVALIPILMLISDLEQVVKKNDITTNVDLLLHIIPFIHEQLKNRQLKNIITYTNIICSELQRILDILNIQKLCEKVTLRSIDPTEFLKNELDSLIDTTRMLCAYKNIDYYNYKEEVEHYE